MLENLGSILGGGRGGSGGLNDLGGVLGSILGKAQETVGGKENLALGGLGALAGALLGGGGKSFGGAVGGGLMALLAAMAYKAMKDTGTETTGIPMGLSEPKTEAERQQLEP
jgi:uncharacterized membrane protein YebE (DUF533 family)